MVEAMEVENDDFDLAEKIDEFILWNPKKDESSLEDEPSVEDESSLDDESSGSGALQEPVLGS